MYKKNSSLFEKNIVENNSKIATWNLINKNSHYNKKNDIIRADKYTPLFLNIPESMINKDSFLLFNINKDQEILNTHLEILINLAKKVMQEKDASRDDILVFYELIQSDKDSGYSKDDQEKCKLYPTTFPARLDKKMANYRIVIFVNKKYNVDNGFIEILTETNKTKGANQTKKKNAMNKDKDEIEDGGDLDNDDNNNSNNENTNNKRKNNTKKNKNNRKNDNRGKNKNMNENNNTIKNSNINFDVFHAIKEIYSKFFPTYDSDSSSIKKIFDPSTPLLPNEFLSSENRLSVRMGLINSIISMYESMKKMGEEILLPNISNSNFHMIEEIDDEIGESHHLKKCIGITQHYITEERNLVENSDSNMPCFTFPFPQNVLKMNINELFPKNMKISPIDQKITFNILLELYLIFAKYTPSRLEKVSQTTVCESNGKRESNDNQLPKNLNHLDNQQILAIDNHLKDEEIDILLEKTNNNNDDLVNLNDEKNDKEDEVEEEGDFEDIFMPNSREEENNQNMRLDVNNNYLDNNNNKICAIKDGSGKTLKDLLRENEMDMLLDNNVNNLIGVEQVNLNDLLLDPNCIFKDKNSKNQNDGNKRFLLEPVNLERENTSTRIPITVEMENEIWRNALSQFDDLKSGENSPTKIFFIFSKLLAKKTFNSKSYLEGTIEEAHKTKKNFQENALNKMKSMLNNTNHSSEMKKIFSTLFMILKAGKQMSLQIDKDDPKFKNLSLFGRFVLINFARYEQLYHIHHNHNLVFFLMTQCFSVYNFSKKGLMPNVLIDGAKSIGKSYAVKTVGRMLIPGTTSDVTHSTAHSEMANTNIPIEGRVNIHDEMPIQFTKHSTNNNIQKNVMTTNQLRVMRLAKDANGNLKKEDFTRSINQIFIVVTNDSMNVLSQAQLSRFYRFALPDGKRVNISIGQLEEASKDKDPEKEKLIEIHQEFIHFLQVLHAVINIYITSEMIAQPTMYVTKEVLPIIEEEIGRQLKEHRCCETINELIRVNTITNAIIRYYCNPDEPRVFTLENLFGIEPYLHDTLEIVLVTLGTAGLFDEGAVEIIKRKILDLLSKKEQQSKTYSKGPEEILSIFKSEKIEKKEMGWDFQSENDFNRSVFFNRSERDRERKRNDNGLISSNKLLFDINYIEFKGTLRDFANNVNNNEPPSEKIRVKIAEDQSVSYEESTRKLSIDQVIYYLNELTKVNVKCYPQLCNHFEDNRGDFSKIYYFPDDNTCMDKFKYLVEDEEYENVRKNDIIIRKDQDDRDVIRIEPSLIRYNNNGQKCDFKMIEIKNNSIYIHHTFFKPETANDSSSSTQNDENNFNFLFSRYLNDKSTSLFKQIHTCGALPRLLDILHRRIFDSYTRPRRIVSGLIGSYSLVPYMLAIIEVKQNETKKFTSINNPNRKKFGISEFCGFKAQSKRIESQQNDGEIKENYDINQTDIHLGLNNLILSEKEKKMSVKDFNSKYRLDFDIATKDIDDVSKQKRLIELKIIPTKKRIEFLDETNIIKNKESDLLSTETNIRIYPDCYIIDELLDIAKRKSKNLQDKLILIYPENNFSLLDSLIIKQILDKIIVFHGNTKGKSNKLRKLLIIENSIGSSKENIDKYVLEVFSECPEDTIYEITSNLNVEQWISEKRSYLNKRYIALIKFIFQKLFEKNERKIIDSSFQSESVENSNFMNPRNRNVSSKNTSSDDSCSSNLADRNPKNSSGSPRFSRDRSHSIRRNRTSEENVSSKTNTTKTKNNSRSKEEVNLLDYTRQTIYEKMDISGSLDRDDTSSKKNKESNNNNIFFKKNLTVDEIARNEYSSYEDGYSSHENETFDRKKNPTKNVKRKSIFLQDNSEDNEDSFKNQINNNNENNDNNNNITNSTFKKKNRILENR